MLVWTAAASALFKISPELFRNVLTSKRSHVRMLHGTVSVLIKAEEAKEELYHSAVVKPKIRAKLLLLQPRLSETL